MPEDFKGDTLSVKSGALASTGLRYHELAMQAWLNKVFLLRWGFPIPVVFTSPMDAFSEFTRLWGMDRNPFQYLLEAKDDQGTPLYLPFPSPVRYPLLSVYRRNWKLRQSHNFSIHRMRNINWPTVSDNAPPLYGKRQQGTNLELHDLGEVTTSRFPMAIDYRFQVDFYCNRPDTQAYFLRQFWNEFWRTGGPVPQTWALVRYPVIGAKLVRVYLDGEIESTTPETPEDGKNVEFRITANLVMEGYDIDVDLKYYPTLWTLITRGFPASPGELDAAFTFENQTPEVEIGTNLRVNQANDTVNYRAKVSNMPSDGTYSRAQTLLPNQPSFMQFEALVINDNNPAGYPNSAGVQAFGNGTFS